MRAAAVRRLRGPVEILDVPEPVPAPGELRVRVAAAGVNPFDWKIADGIFEGKRPHEFPLVLGVDGAGVVDAVGTDVAGFSIGDRVFGNFLHDPVGRGTYAPFVTVPGSQPIALVPEGVPLEVAAAMPMAGMAGLVAIETLGLPKGASLLIVGATGGVGSFATQIAHLRELRVVAAVRAGGEARARALGADEAIATDSGDLLAELRRRYPGGLDGLLDLVGPRDRLTELSGAVRSGGAVATTVFAADEGAMAERGIRATNLDIHPRRELLVALGTQVASGRIRVPLEERAPLSEAPQAIATSRAGKARGKVVLVP